MWKIKELTKLYREKGKRADPLTETSSPWPPAAPVPEGAGLEASQVCTLASRLAPGP